MNNKSYGVLCESENGLDEFNNPKGKRILMEGIGDNLDCFKAQEIANNLNKSKRFGRVILVELVPVDVNF